MSLHHYPEPVQKVFGAVSLLFWPGLIAVLFLAPMKTAEILGIIALFGVGALALGGFIGWIASKFTNSVRQDLTFINSVVALPIVLMTVPFLMQLSVFVPGLKLGHIDRYASIANHTVYRSEDGDIVMHERGVMSR